MNRRQAILAAVGAVLGRPVATKDAGTKTLQFDWEGDWLDDWLNEEPAIAMSEEELRERAASMAETARILRAVW